MKTASSTLIEGIKEFFVRISIVTQFLFAIAVAGIVSIIVAYVGTILWNVTLVSFGIGAITFVQMYTLLLLVGLFGIVLRGQI